MNVQPVASSNATFNIEKETNYDLFVRLSQKDYIENVRCAKRGGGCNTESKSVQHNVLPRKLIQVELLLIQCTFDTITKFGPVKRGRIEFPFPRQPVREYIYI